MMIETLDSQDVINMNRKAITQARNKNSSQVSSLSRPGDLDACLSGVFYRDANSGKYVHLPLENIAGMLLHRIAQGQYFLDGNKRTALLSCQMFLFKNGYGVRVDLNETNGLLWGFGELNPDGSKRKSLDDGVAWVLANIYKLP